MNTFSSKNRSLAASSKTAAELARIADQFSLSQRQRSLQARILGKIFKQEVELSDLPRILRINLNLNKGKAKRLAQAIQKELLGSFKEVPRAPRQEIAAKETPAKSKPSRSVNGAKGLREWFDNSLRVLHFNLSPLQISRLESAVLTYLKDVRDELDTEEVLYRDQEKGGVGLIPEQAAQFMKRLKADFSDEKKAEILPSPAPPPKVEEERPPSPKPSIAAPAPLPSLPKPVLDEEKTRFISDVAPVSEPAPQEQELFPTKGLSLKEITTISQLKDLDLNYFKGKSVQEIMKGVLGKVEMLTKGDETKRLESVQAWRQSLPYKLYIEMGSESISQGKTITQIGEERAKQNKPYFNEEEFNAVADLSRMFQY